MTPGFSGTELANVVNEATLLAVRESRLAIAPDDLEEAIERVVSGPQRRGHILTHVLCTDPNRVDEWDRWYDDVHVPDMLSCGAFSAMSRWRRVPEQAVGPNHLTLYDVATETVEEAVQRSAATLAASDYRVCGRATASPSPRD